MEKFKWGITPAYEKITPFLPFDTCFTPFYPGGKVYIELPFLGSNYVWDRNRACFPKHIQKMQRCALFFSENTLGDGPAFWMFSRIHG